MLLCWPLSYENSKCCHSVLSISIIDHLYSAVQVHAGTHTHTCKHIHNTWHLRMTQTLQYSRPLSEAWLKHLCYKLLYRKERVWEYSYPPTPYCNGFWCLMGNDMQNAHCGGKVMDKIYFLVSYMPIWSCWSESVRAWNYPWLVELTVMSTSIRNLRSAPSALLSYPPDESKSPKTLASGPIYGYIMASSGSNQYCWVGSLKACIWIKE